MTTDSTFPSGPTPSQAPAAGRWFRVGLLILLIVALVVLARVTGLASHLRTEEIRSRMAAAGLWGPVGFIGAFALGEIANVPGTVFVAAAVIAYGRVEGGALGFVGAFVSVCVSFAVVRSVGGKPLGAIRWRFLQRMLATLDDHPIRTIVLLRLFLSMTPQLNYALALSNVRARDYVLASAVGLAPPIAVIAFVLDHYAFLLNRLTG